MALTDLLANVITSIRNAQLAGHAYVVAPSSKLVASVARVLVDEGYIESFQEYEASKGIKKIKIDLKYFQGKPVIASISTISKPGRRFYSGISRLGKSYGGLGVIIVSTSKGVMSDHDARRLHVGGEVLCNVF